MRKKLSVVVVSLIATACGAQASDNVATKDVTGSTHTHEVHIVGYNSPLPDGYKQLAGGFRAHSSCVHEVPNSSKYDPATRTVYVNGVSVDQFDECQYPTQRVGPMPTSEGVDPSGSSPDQEIVFAHASSSVEWGFGIRGPKYCADWFNEISSTLIVPSQPRQNGNQEVYIWQGLQDGASVILQPVIQWGNYSNEGGGTYSWTVTNVFGSDGTFTFSTPLDVNPGDYIYMKTSVDSGSTECNYTTGANCSWDISYNDPDQGIENTYEILNEGTPVPYGQPAVLEAHGNAACADLPASDSAEFTNIAAYQPSSNWNVEYEVYPTWTSSVVPGANGGDANCSYATTPSTVGSYVYLEWESESN